MKQQTLSAHILRSLATAQREGRCSTLETLVDELRVRRADVRTTVSSLDREGFVDATRMRLTLAGFALAASLANRTLPKLRTERRAESTELKDAHEGSASAPRRSSTLAA
jgi:hypothetical protein